jgi:tetratricopeptide (TPR) repeat protein
LRGLREQRRLSLDAVEEMSAGLPERVTKSHLSRIENGRAIPDFPRMFALSQVYGIPVSYLAERFEISLMRAMFPPEAGAQPIGEVFDEAKRLQVAGRYQEALLHFESLLDRRHEHPHAGRDEWAARLELLRVNCLSKLGRWSIAKEECERLLGSLALNAEQHVVALESLAIAATKLGKHAVAEMVIDRAHAEIEALAPGAECDRLRATLTVLRGNVRFVLRRFEEAAESFREGVAQFERLGNGFEACRAQLNLAVSLLELGSRSRTREILEHALARAEAGGFDRQRAYALGHLALLAFRENDLDSAEAHCLRSNALARPQEYASLLWRNCYYLWRIARQRGDEPAAKANERTLRTYLARVEDYMPEVADFKAHLEKG